jgi:hypothetical protein
VNQMPSRVLEGTTADACTVRRTSL